MSASLQSPAHDPSRSPLRSPLVLAAALVSISLLLAGLMAWHPWSDAPEARHITVTSTDPSVMKNGKPKVTFIVDCVQAGDQLTCDWENNRSLDRY
ncbi:hypothetical protein LB823_04955 [Tsukamurella sp. M9C]|uniref:hypothetical protein n=1 Tax=unclassified Tsukamurella TaxID=2633480 RepID=UPI001CCCC912|nr:hypothetical protein [Tsukamurella sp. M9C]MCA0155540.1 hypothetical protein [Tsukamurella sp. M9C]